MSEYKKCFICDRWTEPKYLEDVVLEGSPEPVCIMCRENLAAASRALDTLQRATHARDTANSGGDEEDTSLDSFGDPIEAPEIQGELQPPGEGHGGSNSQGDETGRPSGQEHN